eukprot:2321186-Rhodomonas_salina.6
MPGADKAGPVHPEIKYKKPQSRYTKNQECGFLYLISPCYCRSRIPTKLQSPEPLPTTAMAVTKYPTPSRVVPWPPLVHTCLAHYDTVLTKIHSTNDVTTRCSTDGGCGTRRKLPASHHLLGRHRRWQPYLPRGPLPPTLPPTLPPMLPPIPPPLSSTLPLTLPPMLYPTLHTTLPPTLSSTLPLTFPPALPAVLSSTLHPTLSPTLSVTLSPMLPSTLSSTLPPMPFSMMSPTLSSTRPPTLPPTLSARSLRHARY